MNGHMSRHQDRGYLDGFEVYPDPILSRELAITNDADFDDHGRLELGDGDLKEAEGESSSFPLNYVSEGENKYVQ